MWCSEEEEGTRVKGRPRCCGWGWEEEVEAAAAVGVAGTAVLGSLTSPAKLSRIKNSESVSASSSPSSPRQPFRDLSRTPR